MTAKSVSIGSLKTARNSDWVDKYKCDVYPIWFKVGAGEKTSTIHKRIWGQNDLDKQGGCLTDGEGFAYCCNNGNQISIILSRQAIYNDNISHEIQHAVIATMRWIQAPMTSDTGEQMAHLSGWFSKNVYKSLKKHDEVILDD